MRKKLLAIELDTAEVLGTQIVTVSIGEYEVGRYQPGTRYADTALDTIEKVVASALGDVLRTKLDDFAVEEYEESFSQDDWGG